MFLDEAEYEEDESSDVQRERNESVVGDKRIQELLNNNKRFISHTYILYI